ncbi:hypothetical protein BH11PLA2_BH11PLA2_53220 [soil metagenome]
MWEGTLYLANQWAALNVSTTDGHLAIDNNIAERAIKPFGIGRNYAEFRIMRSCNPTALNTGARLESNSA